MFTKGLICLAIVFLCDFRKANVAGLAITCKSPPVYSGDRALVTCDFNVPVSTTRPAHFAVDFYPEGSTSPVEIAECTNLPDADLDCKAKRPPGETFRITEDPKKLVFEISEATTHHAGRYMCKLSAPDVDPPQLEPCRLTVSDRPRSLDGRRPSSQGYPSSSPSVEVTGSPVNKSGVNWMIVGPAIGGAVFIILLICLVIFLLKRHQHKKSSDAEGNKGNKPLVPQESPKPALALLPTKAVLKTVREETNGQEETTSLVSEPQEEQNEEEGAEKNETYERKRKGSTLSEEVEVVAAVRRIGVNQKLKNREFPWDGSVEDLNKRMKSTENV